MVNSGAIRSFFATPRLASRPASSTPATGRSAGAAGTPPHPRGLPRPRLLNPRGTRGAPRPHDMTYARAQRGGDSIFLRAAPPRQPTRQLDPRDGPQRRCGGHRPQPAAPRAHDMTYASGQRGGYGANAYVLPPPD